jgi:Xaa-Pro dipeptidase
MSQRRLDLFRERLATTGLAGAVIRRPANVYYLTGYPAGISRPSFAVVSADRVALVVPGDAAAAQRSLDPGVTAFGYLVPGSTIDRVADVDRLSSVALIEAIQAAGLAGRRVGIEEGDVSAIHAAAIGGVATLAPLDEIVAGLRRIKDEAEIALIRAAVAVNDAGHRAAARAIAAGATEFQVMNAVVDALQQASDVAVDVTEGNNAFISGPRTMLAAAGATGRKIETGDLMIVDLNPVIRHYKGDTTRTFSVGQPTDEQRRVHDALVRGVEAAEARARPGVRAGDVFDALVAPIIAAGYGTLKFHGGHSIGLEHLERPYIIAGEDMPLAEGMVIALEPGVYLPGIGGLRVEDNYVVRANGLEDLTHYPREITVCP